VCYLDGIADIRAGFIHHDGRLSMVACRRAALARGQCLEQVIRDNGFM